MYESVFNVPEFFRWFDTNVSGTGAIIGLILLMFGWRTAKGTVNMAVGTAKNAFDGILKMAGGSAVWATATVLVIGGMTAMGLGFSAVSGGAEYENAIRPLTNSQVVELLKDKNVDPANLAAGFKFTAERDEKLVKQGAPATRTPVIEDDRDPLFKHSRWALILGGFASVCCGGFMGCRRAMYTTPNDVVASPEKGEPMAYCSFCGKHHAA